MIIPDDDAMVAAGRALARLLGPGDAVCLTGPLGAGKTTFTRGVAEGLGVAGPVNSPTFVISRRHRGDRVDLVHCDAYRLGADDDFADIVGDPESVVTVVEWGESVMPAVADGWLSIQISRSSGSGDEDRHVTVRGVGPGWDDDRVEEVGRAMGGTA